MKVILYLLLTVTVYGNSSEATTNLPIGKTKGSNARIVDGEDADIADFPFQCSLRYLDIQFHNCGGTIISSRHILTANHCVVSGDLYIVVGSTVLTSGSGTRYDVEQVIEHENYVYDNNKVNDIALLKTTASIVFGPNVAVASLPTSDVVGGDLLTITGWGRLYYNGPLPNTLQKIENWPIVDLEECKSMTGLDLIEGQLCAGGRRGQGICNGDSGGPLSRAGTIYGIASLFVNPCAGGLPDMFTRVYYYVDWIQQHVGSEATELQFV